MRTILVIKKYLAPLKLLFLEKIRPLDAATHEDDLRVPPGNQFEHLVGNLAGWCSIGLIRQSIRFNCLVL
ncbi:hypothetical protein OURE66S_04370 [Oligella ureolytica]